MMMGEKDEQPDVPLGPLALPGPMEAVVQHAAVAPIQMETADPVIAFGVAITKEETEEGAT